MSKHVFEATREALGSEVVSEELEKRLTPRTRELKSGGIVEDDFEATIAALKESLGIGTFSPNIEYQVRERAAVLRKGGKVPPAPGTEEVEQPKTSKKVDAGLMNTEGVNAGTDVGKPRAVSIKEGVEGNIGQQQKEAYESGRTKGGGSPTGATKSDVGAAANSGNQSTGGNGAGSSNVNTSR